MGISVTCIGCGKSFLLKDSMAGKAGKCPTCGGVIKVPARAPDPPPAPPEPPVEPAEAGREVEDLEALLDKPAETGGRNPMSALASALGPGTTGRALALLPLKVMAYLATWGGFWAGRHRCRYCGTRLGFHPLPFLDIKSDALKLRCQEIRKYVRRTAPPRPPRLLPQQLGGMAEHSEQMKQCLEQADGDINRAAELLDARLDEARDDQWRLLIDMVDRTLDGLDYGRVRCHLCDRWGCPFCMGFYDVEHDRVPLVHVEYWGGVGGIESIIYIDGYVDVPEYTMAHPACSDIERNRKDSAHERT